MVIATAHRPHSAFHRCGTTSHSRHKVVQQSQRVHWWCYIAGLSTQCMSSISPMEKGNIQTALHPWSSISDRLGSQQQPPPLLINTLLVTLQRPERPAGPDWWHSEKCTAVQCCPCPPRSTVWTQTATVIQQQKIPRSWGCQSYRITTCTFLSVHLHNL